MFAVNPSLRSPLAGDTEDPFRTELDLLFSGYLFFGRYFSPETLAAGETDPRKLAIELLSSRRFLMETVEPLLDGSLVPPSDALDAQIAPWAEKVFQLASGAADSRRGLLACVLDSDLLQGWSISAGLPWSTRGLAAACRRTIRAASTAGSAEDYITAISQGLSKLSLRDISGDGDWGALKFKSDDAWVEFELGQAAGTSNYIWRIDLGFLANSPDPYGSLYLDYGEGFSKARSLTLVPRGRARYPAFVYSAGLKRLRWKPDRSESGGVITVLNARPIADQEFEALALSVVGQMGLNRFRQSLRNLSAGEQFDPAHALRLSQRLTSKLGGHWDDEGDYSAWIRRNELSGAEARRTWSEKLAALTYRPSISIMIVVPNFETDVLDMTLSSLSNQMYPNWRLHLIAPIGSAKEPGLLGWMEKDKARITIVEADLGEATQRRRFSRVDLHITGEWILSIEAGDVLAPHALLEVIDCAVRTPSAAIIYADEDRLDVNGLRTDPSFHHPYRTDRFLPQIQLGNFVAYHTAGLATVDRSLTIDLGARPIIDDALGALGTSAFVHIPQILLHRPTAQEGFLPANGELDGSSSAAFAPVQRSVKRAVAQAYSRIRAGAGTLIRGLK